MHLHTNPAQIFLHCLAAHKPTSISWIHRPCKSPTPTNELRSDDQKYGRALDDVRFEKGKGLPETLAAQSSELIYEFWMNCF
ncbi:hypothetical protein C1H46_039344 [Malus baccata]|uniref:Uncharacterized protein n=1 Tax=Malus baccata TaxID=106549 RepID=A0A540KLL0_MALBA|nr:hypothetical protein C1H46_039344 [Malus baccata]